jgi:diguanylate cyclase (GGDEF)-like protein/PAS domain S-box-containing protein
VKLSSNVDHWSITTPADRTDLPHSSAKLPSLFSPTIVVAAVVATMSACVLGLLVWKASDARTVALAQGERDIRNLTHSLAEHASHTIQAVDIAMSGMVDSLKYRRPDPERFNQYLRNTVKSLPQIREIGVLDATGDWIYSSVPELPRYNSSDRSYFIYHRDSTDASLAISEPLKSRLAGRPTIILSKRITNQDGSFGGALVSAIDIEYFDSFYKTFKFGPHAGITLVRSDGVILVRWPEGQWNKEAAASFKTRVEQAPSGYYKINSPFDGFTKYLGFERASQYPIVVTVALPEQDVLASWHEGLRHDAIVAVILMVSVALLAILLSAQFRARARVENALREREAGYRLLADNIADIVIRFDHEGRILYVSQSVETLMGLKPADLIGKSCFEFVHPDDVATVAKANSELTDRTMTRSVVFRTYRADKSIAWVESNFKLAHAAAGHQAIEAVAVIRDVTERIRMEDELNALNARLAELATTDGLTGLANRRTFDVALPREFRDREKISIVMLDIDHFKGFNDCLGHQAGDDCLKRVARIIGEATENTRAVAARYGGEEFAIILPDVDEQGALKVAEAIRLKIRLLAVPNPAASRGVLSISLGVASRTGDTPDESALLGNADAALYEAKRSGRNCTVLDSSLTPGEHSASRKQYA